MQTVLEHQKNYQWTMTTNPLTPPPPRGGLDHGQRFNGFFLKASLSECVELERFLFQGGSVLIPEMGRTGPGDLLGHVGGAGAWLVPGG